MRPEASVGEVNVPVTSSQGSASSSLPEIDPPAIGIGSFDAMPATSKPLPMQKSEADVRKSVAAAPSGETLN